MSSAEIEKLKSDLAAAQESLALEKSFVHALNGLHAGDIETLKRDLVAAQAVNRQLAMSNDVTNRANIGLARERDEARAEAAALRVRIEELERPQPNGQARKEGV